MNKRFVWILLVLWCGLTACQSVTELPATPMATGAPLPKVRTPQFVATAEGGQAQVRVQIRLEQAFRTRSVFDGVHHVRLVLSKNQGDPYQNPVTSLEITPDTLVNGVRDVVFSNLGANSNYYLAARGFADAAEQYNLTTGGTALSTEHFNVNTAGEGLVVNDTAPLEVWNLGIELAIKPVEQGLDIQVHEGPLGEMGIGSPYHVTENYDLLYSQYVSAFVNAKGNGLLLWVDGRDAALDDQKYNNRCAPLLMHQIYGLQIVDYMAYGQPFRVSNQAQETGTATLSTTFNNLSGNYQTAFANVQLNPIGFGDIFRFLQPSQFKVQMNEVAGKLMGWYLYPSLQRDAGLSYLNLSDLPGRLDLRDGNLSPGMNTFCDDVNVCFDLLYTIPSPQDPMLRLKPPLNQGTSDFRPGSLMQVFGVQDPGKEPLSRFNGRILHPVETSPSAQPEQIVLDKAEAFSAMTLHNDWDTDCKAFAGLEIPEIKSGTYLEHHGVYLDRNITDVNDPETGLRRDPTPVVSLNEAGHGLIAWTQEEPYTDAVEHVVDKVFFRHVRSYLPTALLPFNYDYLQTPPAAQFKASWVQNEPGGGPAENAYSMVQRQPRLSLLGDRAVAVWQQSVKPGKRFGVAINPISSSTQFESDVLFQNHLLLMPATGYLHYLDPQISPLVPDPDVTGQYTFLVVWSALKADSETMASDPNPDNNPADILGQIFRIDSSLNPPEALTPAFVLAGADPTDMLTYNHRLRRPQIALGGSSGHGLVVWQDESEQQVQMRRLASLRMRPEWTVENIGSTSMPTEDLRRHIRPQVQLDAYGNGLVIWQSITNSESLVPAAPDSPYRQKTAGLFRKRLIRNYQLADQQILPQPPPQPSLPIDEQIFNEQIFPALALNPEGKGILAHSVACTQGQGVFLTGQGCRLQLRRVYNGRLD